ncbi:MAG: putative O-glycosylation ligase, exosortase A system-associated [Planctomycetota bacterium]
MRDVVVFLLFIVLLPSCFLRPWFGLLVFSWLAYNRTQDLTWGFARSLPISQLVAVAMVAGWLLWEYRPLVVRDRRIQAMLLMILFITVSMFTNTLRWDYQSSRFSELLKIIFIAILTTTMIKDRVRLRAMALVVCFALAFFGVKNALWFLMGQGTGVGPGGMLKDNNDFALAMVMNLPLLWYLKDEVSDLKYGRLLRPFMKVAFVCTMLTVMSTGSRGGFLSMAVVLLAMSLKTRYKIPALVGVVVLGGAGLLFAPADYIDRLKTITEASDQSIMGRFLSWKVALQMIEQHPLLGIGFKNMVFDYGRYVGGLDLPPGTETVTHRVAHNSYLQVWAESGTPAFLLFMFMIGSTIFFMRRIAKQVKGTPDAWAARYANAIEVTFYGYLTGAMFLNRAHFDMLYQLIAVAVALPTVIAAERVLVARRRRRTGPHLAEHIWVRHADPFVKLPSG